jgi:hypothetical protein
MNVARGPKYTSGVKFAAAGLLAASCALLCTAPAQASTETTERTVTVNYVCPSGAQLPIDWTITAPILAKLGSTVEVEVNGDFGPNTEGVTIPAKSDDIELTITVGGTQHGSVTAPGMTNPMDIAPGAERIVTGGQAPLKVTALGAATLTPAAVTGTRAGQSQTCTVKGTTSIAASVAVIP